MYHHNSINHQLVHKIKDSKLLSFAMEKTLFNALSIFSSSIIGFIPRFVSQRSGFSKKLLNENFYEN